jgi:hypothetical protein
MFPDSLKKVLEAWSRKNLLMATHTTKFQYYPIPFLQGAFNIAVLREVKINFPGKSETVSVKKIFHTAGDASNPIEK